MKLFLITVLVAVAASPALAASVAVTPGPYQVGERVRFSMPHRDVAVLTCTGYVASSQTGRRGKWFTLTSPTCTATVTDGSVVVAAFTFHSRVSGP